jgi:hypothetical protein
MCMAEQMRRSADDVPTRIGPAEFGTLGALITVRCPRDFDHLMRQAGGQWDPGSRRWLIERRRIGPLLRALRRQTDPLFRRAGISLDEI